MTAPGTALRVAALAARLEVAGGLISSREAAERLGREVPPRDHALLLNLVAGTTRHLLTLDHLLSRHTRRTLGKLQPPVLEALRIGAFQLVFCERIPAHAAVGATVEAVKVRAPKGASTVNAVLRALAGEIAGHGPATGQDDPAKTLPDGTGSVCRFSVRVMPDGDPRSPTLLALRASLPAWLTARWAARFGPAEAERLALLTLAPPAIRFRPNPGKAAALPIPGEPLPPGGVTALPGWSEGAFSVQDPTAQAVVSQGLEPKPGERVLDLCAGVGGKACAAAELVGASGKVVAVDQSARRLERLAATAARLGLGNVEAQVMDALALPSAWHRSFDAVLLDAPCTNTGVLRRRPEARWRLKPEDPGRLAAVQGALLEAASLGVKPGGRLVYSTCSLEAEENEGVAKGFLGRHPEFKVEAEVFTVPQAEADGGYWVRLRHLPGTDK